MQGKLLLFQNEQKIDRVMRISLIDFDIIKNAIFMIINDDTFIGFVI